MRLKRMERVAGELERQINTCRIDAAKKQRMLKNARLLKRDARYEQKALGDESSVYEVTDAGIGAILEGWD